MGIFGPDPNISQTEFEKIRSHLAFKGFAREKLNELEQVFRGDLGESHGDKGISKRELQEGVVWMRKNPSKHHFTPQQIDEIERSMKDKL